MDIYGILSGWWFQPINLKNMSEESVGMIILFPTVSGKSFKIPWFQSPPTRTVYIYIIILGFSCFFLGFGFLVFFFCLLWFCFFLFFFIFFVKPNILCVVGLITTEIRQKMVDLRENFQRHLFCSSWCCFSSKFLQFRPFIGYNWL